MTAEPADAGAYRVTLLVYVLQLLTLMVGFPLLIAAAINWLRWDGVRGTAYETHFAWQWDTFIRALVVSVAAVVLIGAGRAGIQLFEVLGLAVLLGGIFWFMYRTVAGLIALTHARAPGPG